jgi:hypothetical protein
MRGALVTAAAASLLLAAGAAPGARPALRVRPASVAPGGLVHISGNADGCRRGDDVLVLSHAFPGRGFAGVGTLRANVRVHGRFAVTGRVRRHARRGAYRVSARCGGGNLGVTATIRVT